MNDKPNSSILRRPAAGPVRRRRGLPGAALLAVLLAWFAAMAALLFRDRLRPPIAVRTAPVLLLPVIETTGDTGQGSVATPSHGVMLFQASGWIEPDPHPVRVAAKTDGFVDEVFALEGQEVRAGDLLATLDPSDARLALSRAVAAEAEAAAALAEHLAALPAAEARERRAVADLRAAEAREAETADRAARLATLGPDDTSTDEINEARRRLAEERAARDGAAEALEEIRRSLDSLRKATSRYEAALDAARVERETASLALDRTRIRAPIDGVVQRRYAAPGVKRMAAMDDPDSASIALLYDPSRLQVRVDVPLSEAGRVATGQMVRVITALVPDRVFTARVTRITGEGDLQRNTLQVKAAIEHPDPRFRPDMLCRAEFLADAPRDAGRGPGALASHGRWVPAEALQQERDDRATVWVVDPVARTASPRDVRLGLERRDGHRQVNEGVREGERVILSHDRPMAPGVRVREITQGDQP